MKYLYLLIFCCLTLVSRAQVRITAENNPRIGNRLVYNINNSSSGSIAGNAGQNQIWDFSNLFPQTRETVNVVRPDNTPGRDSFPQANLVFASGNGTTFSFALSTDSAFFSLGSFINTGDSATSLFTVLEAPRKEIQYPTEFGTRFETLIRNQRNFGAITPGTFLISKEEERILSEADAEGMMQLAQGDFPVIRIKQSRSRTDSTFFESESGRQFISATSSESVNYEWYAEGTPGPLVSLDIPSFGINNATVSILDIENSILGDSSSMTEPPISGFDTVAINSSTYFFINQSQNEPSSWAWDFGDGNTSNLPNVQHQYDAGGTYEVCLEVRNSVGVDTTCKTLIIERLRPLPNFSFSQQAAGLIQFTNLTEGESDQFTWDFGDGNSSTAENPSHQYVEKGSFTACLTASNSFGSDSICQVLMIDNILPTAQFDFQSVGPGLYTFRNLSSTNTDSLVWDFGDGTSSNEEDPSHQYLSEGNFSVCLIAYNALGADTLCQNIVVRNLLPDADFTLEELDFGLFSFTDSSQNSPQSWQWDFGDGDTSTEQNPNHQYTREGNYNVRLIVGNSFGADTTTQRLTVSGLQTMAGFDIAAIGQGQFRFTNLSSNNSTRFDWDFGDGNVATEESPEHQYTQEGFYTVCLIASNEFTSDTLCTTLAVEDLLPQAGFVLEIIGGDSIQVRDTSRNLPVEWLWIFGDGDSSRVQNPGHRYELAGTYEVCLTAKNRFGQDSTCQGISLVFVATQAEWLRPYLKLAPNPFREQLSLNWTPPTPGKSWQYHIFDASGKLRQQGILQNSQEWSTGHWPSGNYWIQIVDQQKKNQLSIPIIKY
jgi:PKD repeat protein